MAQKRKYIVAEPHFQPDQIYFAGNNNFLGNLIDNEFGSRSDSDHDGNPSVADCFNVWTENDERTSFAYFKSRCHFKTCPIPVTNRKAKSQNPLYWRFEEQAFTRWN